MTYRIRAGEFDEYSAVVPGQNVARPHRLQEFIVEARESEQPQPLFRAFATSLASDARTVCPTGEGERGIDEPRLRQVFAVHALPIIEAALRDGSAAALDEKAGLDIRIDQQHLAAAAKRAASKECRYRVAERGDDYCDAGVRPKAQGGGRVRLPTSQAICIECAAPDARLACSNLHHIRTADASSNDGSAIIVAGMECDLGKPDARPDRCVFGGHDCWERQVEIAQPDATPLPPYVLHDAIDDLDMAWRVAFGSPLLKMNVLRPGGVLAIPCSGSQEWNDKLSALGEVWNSFDVQDEDKSTSGPLAKMGVKLAAWGTTRGATPAEIAAMNAAVRVLRATLSLRAGQQHGPARDRYEKAALALGLAIPPASYSDEWNRLKRCIHDACREIRAFIRARL